MDINFKNDALALVGIKSTDPEIVGTDSMDLNIEIPVGETPVKVSFKATSTVASSILAHWRRAVRWREGGRSPCLLF